MSIDPIPASEAVREFEADKPFSVPICAMVILVGSGSLYFLGYFIWLQFERVLGLI